MRYNFPKRLKKFCAKTDNRGVTLVELITSIAIFGIVALACVGLLVFVTKVNGDEYAYIVETRRISQTEKAIREIAYSSSGIYTDEIEGNRNNIYFVFNKDDSESGEKEVQSIIFDDECGEIRYEGVTLISDVKEFNAWVDENKRYAQLEIAMNDGQVYSFFITCKNG